MSKSRIAIMLTILTIVVGIIILGVFLFNKPNSDSKLNKLKNFEKTCTEGKEEKLVFEDYYDNKKIKTTIYFDGHDYNVTSAESKGKGKYLLFLDGKMPLSEKKVGFVVIADKKYTFEEFYKGILSSDSRDSLKYTLVTGY